MPYSSPTLDGAPSPKLNRSPALYLSAPRRWLYSAVLNGWLHVVVHTLTLPGLLGLLGLALWGRSSEPVDARP